MSRANGSDNVESLRERYRLAKARARAAQAEAEAAAWQGMLTEALSDFAPGWSDLADPYAVRRDDFGQVWLPLGAGTMHGRQGGRNRPFAWTDFDLDRQRSLARWLATKNDIAIGALRALRNFTVKKGYKWEARPGKGQEKNPDAVRLAATVQKLIDDHADYNNLSSRERSSVIRSVRDGEAFTRHFCQDDGTTIVRFIEPEQVREMAGLDENCAFGVETEPGDVESPLAYWVSYDGSEWDRVDARDVCHLKRNVDECVKRGMSDFFSSGEALDGVGKLLRNMREAGAVQAAIAWIEQFESSSASQVSAHVAGVKDLNRPQIQRPEVGRNVDYQKFEPGTIVKVGKGKTYMPAPLAGNVANHTSIVQACLRAIGCRWNMPEYLISGDSSNANYASTLVSGSPFVNSIECEQDDFGRFFLRWRWIAVRNACTSGLIPVPFRDVMALVDIHYTAPQVAVASEGEQAEIDHKDIAAGVLSIQTRRNRRGLDDDQERANLKQEPPPAGNEAIHQKALAMAGGAAKAARDASARVGAVVWDALSPDEQQALSKAYAVGKMVLHAAETGIRLGKRMVAEAAKERGFTPEQVEKRAKVIGIVDNVMAWTVNVPGVTMATGNFALGKAAGLMPLASMGYLAYSTARNPLATLRAAKTVLTTRDRTHHESLMYEARDEETLQVLAGRLAGLDDEQVEWYTALLLYAMDQNGHDLSKAIPTADAAFAEHGTEPADASDPATLGQVKDAVTQVQREVKDASGHEHGADGKFGSGGGASSKGKEDGKDKATPEHKRRREAIAWENGIHAKVDGKERFTFDRPTGGRWDSDHGKKVEAKILAVASARKGVAPELVYDRKHGGASLFGGEAGGTPVHLAYARVNNNGAVDVEESVAGRKAREARIYPDDDDATVDAKIKYVLRHKDGHKPADGKRVWDRQAIRQQESRDSSGHADPDPQRESLNEDTARFTGRKKDKLGRTCCYSNGKRVSCSSSEHSGGQRDEHYTKAHESLKQLSQRSGQIDHERIVAALDAVRELSHDEIAHIKRDMGIRAGGVKEEMARKLVDQASRDLREKQKWSRQARAAGIRPEDLHGMAKEVHGLAREYQKTVKDMLAQTRELYKERNGSPLTRGHKAFKGGDTTDLPSFDLIARTMAGRYPEILGAHGYEGDNDETNASQKLYEMLAEGTPPPPKRSQAYQQAFEHLSEQASLFGKRPGKPSDQEVPF